MTNENLNTIGQMRQGLFGQQLGLANQTRMMNYQNSLSQQQAFGNILFNGMGMLGRSGVLGNGGPTGSTPTRSVFSSSNFSQNGNFNLPMNPYGGGGYGYNPNMYSFGQNLRGY